MAARSHKRPTRRMSRQNSGQRVLLLSGNRGAALFRRFDLGQLRLQLAAETALDAISAAAKAKTLNGRMR